MAKLSINHLFASALVLIRSQRRKRERERERERKKGVSGFDVYLLIGQLAVLIKA